MKRFWMVAVTGVLAIALAGCNGGGTSAKGEKDTATPTSDSPLEAIILEAQADFADTSQKILDEQQKMFSEVGDTYDGYVENVDKVQVWYDLAVSETEALGERAVAYGREYYQAVVDNVDVTDNRAWERATEDFYDAIYDDAFDDYYDAVYDDAFDDVYDQYYDGIISDAYDVTPYDEWSDVSSDAYDAYSDAHSDVYDAYSDAHSDVYDDYSDVRSAFYNNDFDVEEIFAPVDLKSDDGRLRIKAALRQRIKHLADLRTALQQSRQTSKLPWIHTRLSSMSTLLLCRRIMPTRPLQICLHSTLT